MRTIYDPIDSVQVRIRIDTAFASTEQLARLFAILSLYGSTPLHANVATHRRLLPLSLLLLGLHDRFFFAARCISFHATFGSRVLRRQRGQTQSQDLI